MDPEVKAFTPHDLKLTEDGEVVVAFAQTDAVDTDDDYTYPGFIVEGKEVPLSQYSHSIWPARGGTLPAGLGSIKELDGWAVIAGRFFMETDQGRNTYHTVKAMGEHQQWSYGFNVTEKAAPPAGIKARRGIKKANVFEVSPVFLGAQSTTHTMAIKEASVVQDLRDLEEDEMADIIQSIKEGTLDGLPFSVTSSRVLRDVGLFTQRAAAIAELRVKEGRAISTSRLELLRQHHAALLAGADALSQLIEGAQPKPKADEDAAPADPKAAKMRMQAQLGMAQTSFASLRQDN